MSHPRAAHRARNAARQDFNQTRNAKILAEDSAKPLAWALQHRYPGQEWRSVDWATSEADIRSKERRHVAFGPSGEYRVVQVSQ
jgi:hypothetical protein